MNIETLHQIGLVFQKDITNSKALNLLNELVENLTNLINQPQQPAFQQNVSNIRINLRNALNTSTMNAYSPYWKQVLDEIGFKDLRGNELGNRIEQIFLQNSITPSIVLQEISNIQGSLSKRYNALASLVKNFQVLGIGKAELNNAESEMAVMIPRAAVKEKIDYFIKELEEIKRIVSDFNELALGSRPEIELKTIASSEYQILLNILPVTATCLIISIEKIVKIYKDILDIRKAHKELKDKGVPAENLAGVEDYANKRMEEGIAEGVRELLSSFGQDIAPGRRKEMEISLKYSMNKLSNRIDKGFNFDIKMRLDEKKADAAEQGEPESGKNSEYYKTIEEKSKELEFLKLSGDNILSLPESDKKDA